MAERVRPSHGGDLVFCSSCGSHIDRAAVCPRCGTPAPGAAKAAAARSSGPAVAITALVLTAVVIVAAIVAGTVLVLDDGDGSSTATEATTTSATPSSTPGRRGPRPAVGSPEAVQETGPGDVADLPAGLFCRDLDADGYSYSAAVTYWRENGQPNQMDEDRNGIPCQTVYSPGDVSAYWGEVPLPDPVADPVQGLGDGLLCRDLYSDGYSYGDAVTYWYVQGLPDRMDEDRNGIPCETVYPRTDVDTYWYG